ncbi:unnamed protein product, partial [Mesorhabditis belari]|uniref:MIF4G domain-containing protein n=1 Tax=Mesorhabditis belari TaxID=2138241 RepID=A0AAF3EQ31_9BILA
MTSYGQATGNPARAGNNTGIQNAQYGMPQVPMTMGPTFPQQPHSYIGMIPSAPIQQYPQAHISNYYPMNPNYPPYPSQMHPQPNMVNRQGYYINPMMMQVHMQPIHHIAPATREKKPLLICDPKTKVAVDVCNSDVKVKDSKILPATNQTAGAYAEKKKQLQMRDIKNKPKGKPTEATVLEQTTENVSTARARISSAPEPAFVTEEGTTKSTNTPQMVDSLKERLENMAIAVTDCHEPDVSGATLLDTVGPLLELDVEKKNEAIVVPPATPEIEDDGAPMSEDILDVVDNLLTDDIDEQKENDEENIKEEAEEKIDEEAETKLFREAELIEEMRTLEEQAKQKVYSRKFLDLICTIEKEFKWTKCPLTEAEIKSLGLDRTNAPIRDNKRAPLGFNPNWMSNRSQKNYVGRGSMDSVIRSGNIQRGQHPRKPHIGRHSIEKQPVPLRRTENAWKADKKTKGSSEAEDAKKMQILKDVRALMNKVTPTTQKLLTQEFLSFEVSIDPAVLKDVIEIIFDKAVEEPKFCPMYSEICKAQVDLELSKKAGSIASPFRNAVLTRSQQTFETAKVEDDARKTRLEEIESETDDRKKSQLVLALQEYDAKIRRRRFGNITFIGQLFCQQLLSYKIVSSCITALLKDTAGKETYPSEIEEAIDCAVRLVESVGLKMEAESKRLAKQEQEQPKKEEKAPAWNQKVQPKKVAPIATFEQYMGHFEDLKKKVSPRIRFMILNLQELRNNSWQKRNAVDQGPKKIQELQADIKNEQIQTEAARARFERDQNRGSSHGSFSSDARKTIGSRGSLNTAWGNSNDRKLSTKATPPVNTGAAPQPKLLASLKNAPDDLARPRWGSKGANSGSSDSGRKISNAQCERKIRESEQLKIPPVKQNDEPINLSEEESQTANSIHSCIEEVRTGCVKIDACPEDFIATMKKKSISAQSFFKAFAVTALREKKEDLKLVGHILAFFLQSDELKSQMKDKSEAAKGIAEFCKYVIATEQYEERSDVWERLAEVIINAVHCDLPDFVGKRPLLEEFSLVFIEASKDPRSVSSQRPAFELLVVALKRMAEILKGFNEQDHATLISMAYEEMTFIRKLPVEQSEKLVAALKEQEIAEVGNLYALLTDKT